ncbi:PREDICTED: uncharacterized protein LOC109147756 [Ipomoea nil]|uniref:uncharacterized protein LOC109147756 n=1 Tax=Ipomoea nil TaxID=35883 RepID=UPI000900E193|nr:PREDICTED: uncharacterized protein LOC109147756 [Ipomoea nil]
MEQNQRKDLAFNSGSSIWRSVQASLCSEKFMSAELPGKLESKELDLLSFDQDGYPIYRRRDNGQMLIRMALYWIIGGLYFVYGYGGTCKTFVWKTLSAAIRSQGNIVLNVASSGIASLLMPGGRTAHSRFAIPIEINDDSTCNIAQGSDLAELIIKCKLIIWDEAPMMHKHCFEALDRTMRDLLRFENILSSNMTFGGKAVVLGGDFRQILPVIPKGTRQDIVGANINSSYLWSSCKVLRLTKDLRLQTLGDVDSCARVEKFAKWITDIGDGEVGVENDGHADIEIPIDNLLQPQGDPIEAIVKSTFSMFLAGNCDLEYLNGRAILASTLDVVNEINQYMSSLNPVDGRTYFSSDAVCRSDICTYTFAELHTPKFLNGLRCSGIPNHSVALKVGSPVMLLRNIDHSLGLCNGTRLAITRLTDHICC